ncbi:hypothetical protein NPIL_369581 [Nephila pilipes]|uniref:Uncharacterized protein n=1 Tax=Nephila pilipes TaxID=299642 RepID=A0A8X6QYN4_NEPPI|nr:hypothetical protein NPIL_369581 [Nephila pilipes]
MPAVRGIDRYRIEHQNKIATISSPLSILNDSRVPELFHFVRIKGVQTITPSTPQLAESINASRVRPIRERDLCEGKVSSHVRQKICPASESGIKEDISGTMVSQSGAIDPEREQFEEKHNLRSEDKNSIIKEGPQLKLEPIRTDLHTNHGVSNIIINFDIHIHTPGAQGLESQRSCAAQNCPGAIPRSVTRQAPGGSRPRPRCVRPRQAAPGVGPGWLRLQAPELQAGIPGGSSAGSVMAPGVISSACGSRQVRQAMHRNHKTSLRSQPKISRIRTQM